MRSIRPLLIVCCTGMALLLLVPFVFFEETKAIVDRLGNHASVLGLFISMIGFFLTVWTVLETLRLNRKFQEKIQTQIEKSRQETEKLLSNIRLNELKQALEEALDESIEVQDVLRRTAPRLAFEKCQLSRKLALRLLIYPDLFEEDKRSLEAIMKSFPSLLEILASNLKPGVPKIPVPDDKTGLVDRLVDLLEKMNLQLKLQLLEVPDDRN